jgi:pimeloyl-ACP methyl ester carboxylesterase
MHDPKLKGRLHRIRIPTLVLWGTADRLTGEAGGAFAAAVPDAKFVTITGARPFPAHRAAADFCRACAGVLR